MVTNVLFEVDGFVLFLHDECLQKMRLNLTVIFAKDCG